MTSAQADPRVSRGLACRPEPHRCLVRSAVFPEVSHGRFYSAVCRLDVHKDSIAVAHATGHRSEPPVFVGAIGTRHADLDRLIRRLRGKASELRFVTKPARAGMACIGISPGRA
jgi:hypothetical protein